MPQKVHDTSCIYLESWEFHGNGGGRSFFFRRLGEADYGKHLCALRFGIPVFFRYGIVLESWVVDVKGGSAQE